MEKKTILQIFIVLLILLVSYLIYTFYYNQDFQTNSSIKKNEKLLEKRVPNEGQNLIQDIRYTSNNTQGDIFEIIADYGETSLEDSDLMFLTNVTGNVIFEKKENIKLVSDFANFNTKTFETTFVKNVKVKRGKETITGNELYLILDVDEEVMKNNPGN